MRPLAAATLLLLLSFSGCGGPPDNLKQSRLLTVDLAGTGVGVVTSIPAGIDCGTTCSRPFVEGTVVTLLATARPGSAFTGWARTGCEGTGPCAVEVQAADETVTATFQVPPTNLAYSTNPAIYTLGVTITPNAPISSGGPVASYSVSPLLPAGLTLDPSTGVITGTPEAVTPSAIHTVTAANGAGSASATVLVSVNDDPPSDLAYSANPATFTVGVGAAPDTPSNAGGDVASYSLSPDLPAGLIFSEATGVITGTPTAVAAAASYAVAARNPRGFTTATLTIAVNDPTVGMNGLLAAGYDHTCAIVDGGVQCWGNNDHGQLGTTTTACDGYRLQCSTVPLAVYGPSSGVQAVSAGYDHTCAIVNGDAWCWGGNSAGELGSDASALCGGVTCSPVPVAVSGLSSGVQAIAAGGSHTCAIVNGGVQCWGYKLGNGSTTDSQTPVPVPGLAGVEAIAAGGHHACALVDGGVRCWGENDFGQLGDGSTADNHVPVPVPGLQTRVTAISAGEDHTCAILDGGVQCWGRNRSGQLGDNTTTDSASPVAVFGLPDPAQAIAAGGSHTCAILGDGVRCWGRSDMGQLGYGSPIDSHVPVPASDLSSSLAIAAGDQHSCAIANGAVRCWGADSYGQVGNGTLTERYLAPLQVSGLSNGVP